MPGRMRERVEWYVPSVTADGAGGQSGGWLPQAGFWAEVEAVSGRGRMEAAQAAGLARYRFLCREGIAPKPGQRLKWQGRWFVIGAVLMHAGLRPRIEITAEEQWP